MQTFSPDQESLRQQEVDMNERENRKKKAPNGFSGSFLNLFLEKSGGISF